MRARALVLAAVVAAALSPAAGGAAGVVTIRADEVKDPASFFRQAWLRGVATAAAPGSSVEILVRECGATVFREYGGAQVTAGRTWETKLPIWERTEYRARFGRELSAVATVVPPILVSVEEKARGRRIARLYAESLASNFGGKKLVLQRLGTSGWVDVRTLTLRRGADLRTFEAPFAVRTRGLTMRLLAPSATTRPCFRAGTSAMFRS